MTRAVIAEVIKATPGSNKMDFSLPRLIYFLPLLNVQPNNDGDIVSVFHMALSWEAQTAT